LRRGGKRSNSKIRKGSMYDRDHICADLQERKRGAREQNKKKEGEEVKG